MSRRVRAERLTVEQDWPLCCSLLSKETRQFWHGRGRPGNRHGTDHCGNYASYKIGGKYYCGKHAGTIALKLLVENGGIERRT